MSPEIKALQVEDWASVAAIYRQGIDGGQATFEISVPSWEAWDKSHLSVGRLVARRDDRVVGWAALSPVSARQVYAGVAEVSVYVATDSQRAGVGRALLEELVAAAERERIWTLQAAVFPENVATLALHRSCGFREVGRRHRIAKLNGQWRDTILLERRSSLVGVD